MTLRQVQLKDADGNDINPTVSLASTDNVGVVKPDGTTLSTANDGTASYIGGVGMPMKDSESVTLGNSGWQYTATRDGYIMLCKRATATGQYFDGWVNNGTDHVYGCSNVARDSNAQGIIFLPMKKGSTISVYYNFGGTTEHSHFIYADR